MSKLRALFSLLKETFQEWNEDKAPRLAAALAYYTAFSITPLLVVIISIAGLLFGRDAVQGRIRYEIQGMIGWQAAGAVQDMLANFSHPSSSILATIIGLVTLLLGAAGLFGQLQDALNTVWEVTPKPGLGIMGIVRQRFISFTMVLGIGFLLLVSLVVSAALATLSKWISIQIPGQDTLLQILNFVISFGVITLLFAMIYKVLPDVMISWRDVWMGAAVTALLFTIGKLLLGLYLGSSTIGSSYGAAGSFVVLLLWIYYSAQILLFGAEFTQVYARTYGSRIQPSRNAVLLSEIDRVQQGIPRTKSVEKLASPRLDTPEERRLMVEHQRLAPATEEAPPESHLGVVIVGICAAIATFVLGLLISGDQRTAR